MSDEIDWENESKKANANPSEDRKNLKHKMINKGLLPDDRKPLIKLDNYMSNVEEFFEYQPFFYDKQNMFWLWSAEEKKYEMVDDTDMMILIEKVLGLDGQTVNSTVKCNYLEAFKRVGRQKIPKQAPKKWVQFKDKAISLESGNIYDITPDFFFTNPIPWELGTSEDTPIMDKLILEWVGEKYVKTAYEMIAYCCYADYPIHLIFCFVGIGRNGKSKFLGLINNFIGKDNICSTELDVLLNSRFESFKLYKKLACTMGETNFGIISKTSLLKKLTGQDMIGFEFKNKKPFDDYNYAKIIISSNSLPPSTDTSEGFYRRWMILDFPNIFEEGKDILKLIPKSEYNNMALKVSKILPKLIESGCFTNQGTIQERTEKYVMASNPLSYFIKESCKRGFGLFMRYSELYTSYRQYLHNQKRRRVNYSEFNDILALEGLEIVRTSKKVREEWINDKWIEGIELIEESCVSCVSCVRNLTSAIVGGSDVSFVTQLTQLTQTKDDENAKTYSFDDFCTFIKENDNKYPSVEFIAKYGLEIVSKLLKRGDIIERNGYLEVI